MDCDLSAIGEIFEGILAFCNESEQGACGRVLVAICERVVLAS
jgi:hypothetical protein